MKKIRFRFEENSESDIRMIYTGIVGECAFERQERYDNKVISSNWLADMDQVKEFNKRYAQIYGKPAFKKIEIWEE